MTVNKLTYPSKENAVQEKINEIIDNLGASITVDQTFDGTSANPQSGVAIAGAGFVTSVNNVSPVSGDVTLTASDVGALPSSTTIPALYSTTGSNTDGAMTQDATTNALNGKVDLDYSNADYQPVNKSGDTMTGALFVNTDDTANQAINIGNVSTNQRDIVFRASNHRVATIRAVKDANNNCTISIGANGVNDSAATGFLVTRDSSDNASCSFPATKCVDGQWVGLNQSVISSNTSLNGSTPLTYTLNLPTDGAIYEVLIYGEITTGATSGNYVTGKVHGSRFGTCCIGRAQTRSSSAVYTGGSGTVIVGSDRKITVERSTNWNGHISLLFAVGYRRIGTNS